MKKILSSFFLVTLFSMSAYSATPSKENLELTYSYFKQARTMGELVFLLPTGKEKVELFRFVIAHKLTKVRIPDVKLLDTTIVLRIDNKPVKVSFRSENQVLINERVVTLDSNDNIETIFKKISNLKAQKHSLLEVVVPESQAQVETLIPVLGPLSALVYVGASKLADETELGRKTKAKGDNEILKWKGSLLTKLQCTESKGSEKGKLKAMEFVKNDRHFAVELAYENEQLVRLDVVDHSCDVPAFKFKLGASQVRKYETHISRDEFCADVKKSDYDCVKEYNEGLVPHIKRLDSSYEVDHNYVDADPRCSSSQYFVSGDRITSVKKQASIQNLTPTSIKDTFANQDLYLLDAYCKKPELEREMQAQITENLKLVKEETLPSELPAAEPPQPGW